MTDLLYSEVEDQLRSSVRDLLRDRAPWSSVLACTEAKEPYDPSLWQALSKELGVTGLAVPESLGGDGASWRETAVVAEELGRSVAATPLLGSAVLATALGGALGADDLVRGLAAGSTTATVAVALSATPGAPFPATVRMESGRLSGTVRNVADIHLAEHLLVACLDRGQPAIAQVAAADVHIAPAVSLDLTRPVADVSFDGPAEKLGSGSAAAAALDTALTTGATVLASEQLGIAERCLEMTVEHLKTRYQFGRPIGSFQALKHRAADLWAAVSQARAVARYAASCLADGDADLPIAAALAEAYCGPVAVRAAEECVQLHGGIGFTWEHPAHLYLKRAKADAIAFGTAATHRARLAGLVNLPAA